MTLDRKNDNQKTYLFSKGSAPLEQGFEVALPEDLDVVQVSLDVLGGERK